MKISRKIHSSIRLQNIVFNVLFVAIIGVLAWLSTQYSVQSDWTKNAKNTLSIPSQQLLKKLNKPIQITAFVAQNELIRKQIQILASRYQAHKKDFHIEFINPDQKPDLAREENISTEGQLIIRYDDRRESVLSIDEQSISDALQRLSNSKQRWLAFLTGHGERNPIKEANFDLSLFGQNLKQKGFNIQTVNLLEAPSIPENTSVLIIASPQTGFLDTEINIITRYINNGGALLWLSEPNQDNQLSALATQLGLRFLPGIVVDASTQTFGIDDPTFALITQYSNHESTRHIQSMSLFPGAQGLIQTANSDFSATTILATLARSWTETSNISGNSKQPYQLKFNSDSDEQAGPIDIGLALSRQIKGDGDIEKNQRIAVIGDGDFLTNTYIGNGANLDVGLSLVRWLSHDDSMIDIPAKTASDLILNVTPTWTIVFGLGFLLFIPAGFIGLGVYIWLKRRKR